LRAVPAWFWGIFASIGEQEQSISRLLDSIDWLTSGSMRLLGVKYSTDAKQCISRDDF
jgi:hypothetical protein